jgi:hypothetical protein
MKQGCNRGVGCMGLLGLSVSWISLILKLDAHLDFVADGFGRLPEFIVLAFLFSGFDGESVA